MHWTEEQALRTDVRFIETACTEHLNLVNLVHFGKLPEREKRRKKVTAWQWRQFAGRHNAVIEKRGKR